MSTSLNADIPKVDLRVLAILVYLVISSLNSLQVSTSSVKLRFLFLAIVNCLHNASYIGLITCGLIVCMTLHIYG